MIEDAAPAIYPELGAYIRAGGAVRTEAGDAFSGRCGKRVERRAGDVFCRRAAGWGTDHLRIGPCRGHELDGPGLAPWVGDVSAAEWRRITGHNVGSTEGRGFEKTHGATAVLSSIEEMFAACLPETDRPMFHAVPVDDPKRLLDVVLRVNLVALSRVQSHITHVRGSYAQQGKQAPIDATAGAESLGAKISSVIARLQEARSKYVVIDKAGEAREGLADLLRGLSSEDFARVSADPSLLAAYRGLPG